MSSSQYSLTADKKHTSMILEDIKVITIPERIPEKVQHKGTNQTVLIKMR
jgi:hypothetical protein